MKKRVFILFSLLPIWLFSCVKTEVPDCPDGGVTSNYLFLVVGDRSYENDNTDSDQFMPYSDYIANHFHVWHNLNTGEEIKGEDYEETNGSSKRYPVSLDGMAATKYRFTSWGNLSGIDAITSGTYTRADGEVVPLTGVDLHPDGMESTDIYRTSQDIDLTPGNEQANMLPMDRAKGLLSVEYVNFPADVTRVDVNFGPVSAHIDNEGNYTGSVTVTKSFTFNTPPAETNSGIEPFADEPTTLDTFMAPTKVEGAEPKLNVSLYREGDSEPFAVLPGTDPQLRVTENEITTARVAYDTESGQWQLLIQVDGAWRVIYDLIVTPV